MTTYDIIIDGGNIDGKARVLRVVLSERLDGDEALQANTRNNVISLASGSVVSYSRAMGIEFSDDELTALDNIISVYSGFCVAYHAMPVEQQYASGSALANTELDAKNAVKALVNNR